MRNDFPPQREFFRLVRRTPSFYVYAAGLRTLYLPTNLNLSEFDAPRQIDAITGQKPAGHGEVGEYDELQKVQCCYRDNDRDGNCDLHQSPGVLRPHIRRAIEADLASRQQFFVSDACPIPFNHHNYPGRIIAMPRGTPLTPNERLILESLEAKLTEQRKELRQFLESINEDLHDPSRFNLPRGSQIEDVAVGINDLATRRVREIEQTKALIGNLRDGKLGLADLVSQA